MHVVRYGQTLPICPVVKLSPIKAWRDISAIKL